MNLPNKLTLVRIILVPFVMFFIMLPKMVIGADASGDSNGIELVCGIISAAIFAIAALTDMFDGKIARKRGLITDFGKFMDPIADKLLIFGTFIAFIYASDYFSAALVWMTVILLLREFAVTSVRLLAQNSEGVVIAASNLGKIKTVSQCISVLIVILEPYILGGIKIFAEYRLLSWTALTVMIFFAVYSGIDYIASYWKYITPNK